MVIVHTGYVCAYIYVLQEHVFQGFLTIMDEVLLPSLSLLPSNCGMAEEVWAMVKQLPYQNR